MIVTPIFNTAEVMDLMRLRAISAGCFRGGSLDIGTGRTFGGQLLGQALQAAAYTVEHKSPASMHAVFVAPGNCNVPIDYQVERVREGRTFSSRRVVASQRGRQIFNMATVFHGEEEGISRFIPMPEVEWPDTMRTNSPPWRHRPAQESSVTIPAPVDFRCSEAESYGRPLTCEPSQQVWTRAPVAPGGQRIDHAILFAYISDYGLLWTAIKAEGIAPFDPRMQASSLNHTIWFHRPFRIDEWLLFSMSSPSTASGRGLNLAHVYDRQGGMVATVAQEGLFRLA